MTTLLERRLVNILSLTWYMILIRGVFAVIFSIYTVLHPHASLKFVITFFGVYVLADGIAGAFSAVLGRKQHDFWIVLLLWAVLGVGVGLVSLFEPALTARALVLYVALWAIATGVLEIVAAIRLRKEIEGEWRLIAAGVLSAFFGAFLIARPVIGAFTLLWLVAAYAFVFGILMIILAFRVRAVREQFTSLLGANHRPSA